MKILIVKTSSLGDIIHTFPALTDAATHFPAAQFDWVVEENFAEVVRWHQAVHEVIPVAIRRWRKKLGSSLFNGEIRNFYRKLRAQHYDIVIDAQGLLKSAWFITRFARGLRCGLNYASSWEGFAATALQRRVAVNPDGHAVTRMRQLFAQCLQYSLPVNALANYGFKKELLTTPIAHSNYVVFLHGTTWPTKHYPETYWRELAHLAQAAQLTVLLPWGNTQEQERAQRIAADLPAVHVLPKCDLTAMAGILYHARAIVGLDTGLGHLAAAMGLPVILLYGPTDPAKLGEFGLQQKHLSASFACSPCWQEKCQYSGESVVKPACFAELTPALIWKQLQGLMRAPDVTIHS